MPARDALPVGLLAIAFSVSIFFYGGDSAPYLTYATLLLLAAALIRIQHVISTGTVAWSPVHWWVLAYVAWLGALVWLSTMTDNSRLYFWVMASFAVVFLLAVNLSRDFWLRLFGLFMIAGLASACWGLGEFVVTEERANGPMIDPNVWASLHNLFFFSTLAVFLTIDSDRRRLGALGVALFIFAAAVACAYSRVANVVFVAALVFVLVLTVRYAALRRRLAVVTLVSVLAFSLVHVYVGQSEASHPEGYTLDTETKGWSQRLSMWRAGLSLYSDHPLTGSGPATFKVHYPRYRDMDDLGTLGNYMHNDYLQYLAEGGPLLLSFLLAFVGFLALRLFRGALGLMRGDGRHLESVVLIVAIGTGLTHALMNFVLYQLQFIFLSAICFARLVNLWGMLEVRRVEITNPVLARTGSAVFTVLLMAIVITDQLTNDLVYRQAGLPLTGRIRDDQLAYFQTMRALTALRSDNSGNHFAMATLYRISFDTQASREARQALGIATAIEYQRGLALNPFPSNVRRYFADFLVQNPWLQEYEEITQDPEGLLREGVRLAPVYVENYLALADYLEDAGREEEAYRLLREDALPWAGLKYPHFRPIRERLFKRLLRESVARGDEEVPRQILAFIAAD